MSTQKEFQLSSWAINNKTTVFVITFIILLAGYLSYKSMPRENFPEIVIPQISVITVYPGNSALDIEKLITKPLEKEINAISGVDEIISNSVQGFSNIQVKFDFNTTPSDALQKVKDKVDAALSDNDFPKDLPSDPSVKELNFSEMMPIMNINLSGEFSMEDLKKYAEYLEDKIEELTEISGVDIRGVQDKEVEVSIDLYKMEASKISFTDIENAIAFENMTVSGGNILQNGIRRNVRVIGEFTSPKEIENIIVKHEKGHIVYLRDIAHINFKEQEKESYAREYSHAVVMLDVKKRGGENLLNASKKIDEILADAKKQVFPENLVISKTNDQSNDTKTMVSDLENSIILGVILVVLVLFFFLGFRNALFVGIAIPLSMFLSFIILSFMGVTLNTMVLFSLVIALGMLVDNGIVVVENIYRLMDEGYPRIQAAKIGVGEVAMPIIASTATTLAAFFPLILWDGIMGEFMKYLPITLIIVLSSSLFVALVINPVLTSIYMKVVPKQEGKKSILNRLEDIYQRFLNTALQGWKPYLVVVGTFALLLFAIVLMGVFPPKTLFFPNTQAKQVFVYVEYPIGTDIEQTNTISKQIERDVEKYLKKYEEDGQNYLVTSIIGQVGEGTADPQRQDGSKTPNKARITVDFVKFQDRRGVDTELVLKDIRNLLHGYPGVSVIVDKPKDGPPTGAPINMEVTGDDYNLLLQTANQLKEFINNSTVDGIEELKLDIDQGKPEMPILVDRQKARRLGVSTGQIGGTLRTSLYGKEISTFKDIDDDYPINIRLMDKYRYNKDALLNQKITFRNQSDGQIKQIPISAIATAKESSTFSAVKHIDLKKVVTLFSNVLTDYNATEVNDKLRETVKEFKVPEGVSIDFTGEQEEQAKQMSFLSKALLIAVALIFLIMVGQFNSATVPIIISISVLLSLIGVLFGLLIFRMEFVVLMTMIGVISLAGIVVNNAIVLIDYTLLIIKRKHSEKNIDEKNITITKEELIDSIVEGGKTRLRPVLLTAITTILGLLPLALGININFSTLVTELDPNFYIGGENVAFWGPMSWTIIFGLTFATFLTLIVVPILFFLVEKFKMRFATS